LQIGAAILGFHDNKRKNMRCTFMNMVAPAALAAGSGWRYSAIAVATPDRAERNGSSVAQTGPA
jgi:hypothetical protein